MLFSFPFFGRPEFTLANTKIPLDVIFLRTVMNSLFAGPQVTARVISIISVAARDPEPVAAEEPYDLVLEVYRGDAARVGIKVGGDLCITGES